jgi:hypothetical protein
MKSKFWQNNRSLTVALFAVLAVNWWMGYQPRISGEANLSATLPADDDDGSGPKVTHHRQGAAPPATTTTSTTANSGGDKSSFVFNTSALNGCDPDSDQPCTARIGKQSGKTKEDVAFEISFKTTTVDKHTDRFGNVEDAHTEVGYVISEEGCDVCTPAYFHSSAKNSRDLLSDVAHEVDLIAADKVQKDEQARLDAIKQKKIDKANEELAKAVDRCEKKDDGTTDDNGIPKGTKLEGEDKLDCMVDKLGELTGSEATKYYSQTLMPFLNQMLGSNNSADRDSANNMLANIRDAADNNIPILQSVAVLQRVSAIQDQIFTAAQRIQASANNPIAKVAATQQLQSLQAAISADPVLQSGGAAIAGGRGVTNLGAETATHWQQDLLNTLQLAAVNPGILAGQTGATVSDNIPQITDALANAQAQTQVNSVNQQQYGHGMLVVNGHSVQNLGVPVPGSAAATSSSVFANQCLTRGVGTNCQNQFGPTLN